jgi:hypothetical protein
MKRVFEINVNIFTSNYREKILVEADNEIEAIKIIQNKFYDFWCDYFSNNLFYEYHLGNIDEVTDVKSSKYKNLMIFSKNGFDKINEKNNQKLEYYEKYGFNENQLSIF